MTENEAIRQLKYMYKTCMDEECKHKGQCDLCCEARDMAIQALEKVQAFESIGTIEEFKALKASKEFFDFDSPVVNIDKKSYNKAIDDAIEKFLEYGCVCVEWNKSLSKERLVDDVIRQVIGQVVYGLEKLKGGAE